MGGLYNPFDPSDVYGSIRDSLMYDILMNTANLRFLWLLDETSGTTAADASGNSRTGTYDGVTLNQYYPGWSTIKGNTHLMKSVKFDGVNDKITGAAGTSVRGLAAITWAGVVSIPAAGASRTLWYESVAVTAGNSRLFVNLQADGTLQIVARSGTSAQTASVVTTSSAIPEGPCIIHVTVDISNDAITISRNGAVLAATGTPDFGADTIFVDTAPAGGPYVGYQNAGSEQWYNGYAAYVALYSGVLTQATMLGHAKAGGFA